MKDGAGPSQWEENPPPGGLYSLNLHGELKQHSQGIQLSNGIAWSSDGRLVFHIDTFNLNMYVFDHDIESESLSEYLISLFD